MPSFVPYLPWKPVPCSEGAHDLPRFLCPVCAENLFQDGDLRDHPCRHVPVVRDRDGSILCWDGELEAAVVRAWRTAAATGAAAIDVLREQLGPDFLFFELVEPSPLPERSSALTVVVDLRGAVPRACLRPAA